MLKYFKRQKSQRSAENDNDVAASSEKRHSLLSTSTFCDEILDEDTLSLQSYSGVSANDANIGDDDIFNYHSRLSMSLTSILKDPECLTCFVQYLETKHALPIIKFYLDTENFKISALEQLTKAEKFVDTSTHNEFKHLEKEALLNNNINKEESSDCLDAQKGETKNKETTNNVPELKTLCDLSMHKPLTDDEKSQIYAETNKHITVFNNATAISSHKLKACSQQSLFSELSIDAVSTNEYARSSPNATCVTAASIKDALTIYQKYLSSNSQHFVELPVNVLSDISLLLCKRQDDSGFDDEETLPISANCFDEAQQFVLSDLERLYLNDFLQSTFYCKYCLELVTDEANRTDRLTISDLLYSEVTLFFFMEFLEQQGERECLDFWTTAINFRKSYANLQSRSSADPKEIQQDAMIIYKKFFSLQSDGRLWLSDKLRCHVEACICAPPEKIANCFDLALVVTAKYLEKKYFSAFLKSEIFAQYVNELKLKIIESCKTTDNFDDIGHNDIVDGQFSVSSLQHKLSFKGPKKISNTPNSRRRHRKTMSDCTNDITRSDGNCGEVFKHISQHNTLLAMDSSGMHLKNLQNSGTSMSIDARQLTNPHLLWHRKHSKNENGGLKFGYVNALGRYERDFETIESFNNQTVGKHHWSLGVSGNKIKTAMRKLVNLPEHKAQEEIAWQIAEMIIKDVTSVTLKKANDTAVDVRPQV